MEAVVALVSKDGGGKTGFGKRFVSVLLTSYQ